jgi:hypothetical protein
MKFCLAFFLCIFSLGNLLAQKASEGESWQNEKNFYPLKFIGEINDKLMLAYGASEKGSSHIQHIDIETIDTAGLKHVSTKNFQNVFSDKFDFYPEDIQLKNGKLNFLGSTYDKKTKNNVLYRKEETDSGIVSEKKMLWEYLSTYFEASSKKFKFCTSKNQDLLLSLGVQTGAEGNYIVHFAIIDNKYEIIKKRSALLDLKGRDVKINQFSIDEPGNVQFLVQYQRSEDSLDLGFSLFAFPIFTDDILEYQLDLPEKQITSVYYDLTENDHLKICGLYQTDFKKTDISAGTFYMDIDRETGEVIQKSIVPFNASFLGNFSGEAVKMTKDDFKYLKIISASCNKDGSLQLYAEQTQADELCETDYRSGLQICKDEFKTDKVLIINFNSSANVDWFQWLFKKQYSLDDEGMFLSFNLIQEEKTSLFLYNDLAEKKKQENQISAKSATIFKAMLINTSGQFQEIAFPLSCKFPVVHNSYFESKSSAHYFLRSDLNYNSVLKIRY